MDNPMSAHFSFAETTFDGITFSRNAIIVGYAAIIEKLELPIPQPDRIAVIGAISPKPPAGSARIISLPKAYQPEDHSEMPLIAALYKHLVFALKYEGVNLSVFAALCHHFDDHQLAQLVSIEPTGRYSRRIWFALEWIMGRELSEVESISGSKKSYVEAVDPKLQFALKGVKSVRHLVINNFPGTRGFCPLVRKSDTLMTFIGEELDEKAHGFLQGVRKDLMLKASAFLLLKDSKASFTIEGESPKSKRATLWGQAIGQAGAKALSHDELNRLQHAVIENPRFLTMGYRKEGGFVGVHDRVTGAPMPDHISAKPEDLEELMEAFVQTTQLLLEDELDAVVVAAAIAFGFVFIHPFADGNGRIHRYLIHHALAVKRFSQQGMIFPVSAAILDQLDEYRKALEHYSHPVLGQIQWEPTPNNNIKVLNRTIDHYRYFDATHQAEFLYRCVKDTLDRIIPEEVDYLQRFEEFKSFADDAFEMPDRLVNLLVRFLYRNQGRLSQRARSQEFAALTDEEVVQVEAQYARIFG